MLHLAKTYTLENSTTPFGIQCSCGVGGAFKGEQEAHDWMQYKHFSKLTGIAYGEFFLPPPPPVPAPATPPESGTEVKAKVAK